MKTIVAFIGSLRAESTNRSVYNAYTDLASDTFKFIEAEIANISHYNQDTSPEPTIVTELTDAIAAADGIIFFSPEYNYSVPGVLKNAIDWLSRNQQQPFNGKPAAVIGASPGNVGTARMQYHLRQIGVFLNLHFLNKPEVMIGQAMAKINQARLTDESTIQHLQKHVAAFSDFIAQLNTH